MNRTLTGRLMRAEIIRVAGLYDRVMLGRLALRIAIAPVLVAAFGAAGCDHAQVAGGNRTLRVGLTEYRLNPQHARVDAGSLTISVHNFGRLSHSLSLTKSGQAAGATKPIAPGQSAQLLVTVVRGTYVMASTLLDDQALGQYGTLSVR